MFDARSLLENLIKGAAPPPPPQQQAGGLGGLGDILGKMMQGGGGQQTPAQGAGGIEDMLRKMMPGAGGAGAPQGGGQAGSGMGGLEDMLRKMLPGAQQGSQGGAPSQGGGGLADILGKLGGQQGGGGQSGAQAPGGGGLMDILGQVLGQATSGVKEGARRVDDATGIGRGARDAVGQTTGQSPEELMAKLKELIAQNQMGAAAAGAGAGAVILGTQTGRSIASSALKLGGLALIGGLAYKALLNYQQGKPLLTGADPKGMQLQEAPRGSGFETQAVTNDAAILYISGMIAAAAADGRLDAKEHQKILGGLKQAGIDAEAEEFLAQEINSPASVQQLASMVKTEQEAVQLFTAARIAVDLDTQEEHDFLVTLAQALQLDGKLVAHIDAAARGATV